MRFLADRRFITTCLVWALPFVAVVCFTPARGWGFAALAGIVLWLLVGTGASGNRQPTLYDTERFLIGALNQRGFTGAFRLAPIEHRVTPGSARDSVHVTFQATLTLLEPLYQATVPPVELCGSLTPRRIAALGKIAARLAEDGAGLNDFTLPTPPGDPYSHHYVNARSEQGWTLALAGAARATHSREHGWHFQFVTTPREFDTLQQAGRPRAAFFDAIALDTAEGLQALQDNLHAWAEFEAKLAEARTRVDQHRTRRGHDALAIFFATHPPGTTFQGVGETVTQKIVPRAFVLEFVATDAARHRVHFTLRTEVNRSRTRRFAAEVEHDPENGYVRLIARTTTADAVPGAGPLLEAAAGFTLGFSWRADDGAALRGEGADFVLHLRRSEGATRGSANAAALEREREVWQAVAPGTTYAGTWLVDGRDRKTLLSFLPGETAGGVIAQIECEAWSGRYLVTRATGGEDHDLALEPAAIPVAAGADGETTPDVGRILTLRVNGRELLGTGGTRINLQR